MQRILDRINSPADVKKLTLDELTQLAQEIREELIRVIAKNGGHLGPNLGVVELTIALHYVFDTPTDNFVFDVSHQCYVHKILTGRRDRFHTIRQPGGINGFMQRVESEHDCFGAGHAGTALSAALGMAVARDMRKSNEHVVALCGDAAFTCGITYEALNNVAAHTKKLIVILNDNEWSIDKNVGAIANYFNAIATNERFAHLHEKAEKFIEKVAGRTGLRVAKKAEGALKGLVTAGRPQTMPSVIFEEMGLTYYGPIDGHDLPTLIKTFEFLKSQDHPVLLHALTQKSRGFDLGLSKQKKYHGVGPNTYDPETCCEVNPTTTPTLTYSQVFADTLTKLADMNNKVVAITGAMPNGTALDRFQPKHPDKYFDVGIAEEHAVIFAAGLATKGYKPYCAIYSTFLQRAYDPIIHDVAVQNLPVVFAMDRGGLSGDDGWTHHGLFDISYMRCIPNIVHAVAKDGNELSDLLYTAMHHNGPIAIRYPREATDLTKVKDSFQQIPVGKAEVLKHGNQVAIFALGVMIPLAIKAAEELEKQGFSTAVINGRWTKPVDVENLRFFAESVDLIVTMEDHVLKGGYGSAVLEELAVMRSQVPVVRIGWPDEFVNHGKVDFLRAKHGLTVENTVEQALSILKPAKGGRKPKAEPAVA
jgi:1-deoxy-D-xylulose-5-phosphate synthase